MKRLDRELTAITLAIAKASDMPISSRGRHRATYVHDLPVNGRFGMRFADDKLAITRHICRHLQTPNVAPALYP
jgi:hypothetical protein